MFCSNLPSGVTQSMIDGYAEEAPSCDHIRCDNEGIPCEGCGLTLCNEHKPFKDSELCQKCVSLYSDAAEKVFTKDQALLIVEAEDDQFKASKLSLIFHELAKKYDAKASAHIAKSKMPVQKQGGLVNAGIR